MRLAVKGLPNVVADAFDGLLVDYVEKRGGQAVIRGLRAVSDFEFEFQLALMNRKLNERVETIFMMPKETYTFLSSRIVKEIARLGGDVSHFRAAARGQALRKKLGVIGRGWQDVTSIMLNMQPTETETPMPLPFNLRHLEDKNLHLNGELPRGRPRTGNAG